MTEPIRDIHGDRCDVGTCYKCWCVDVPHVLMRRHGHTRASTRPARCTMYTTRSFEYLSTDPCVTMSPVAACGHVSRRLLISNKHECHAHLKHVSLEQRERASAEACTQQSSTVLFSRPLDALVPQNTLAPDKLRPLRQRPCRKTATQGPFKYLG